MHSFKKETEGGVRKHYSVVFLGKLNNDKRIGESYVYIIILDVDVIYYDGSVMHSEGGVVFLLTHLMTHLFDFKIMI